MILRLRQLLVQVFPPQARFKIKRFVFQYLMGKKPLHFIHIGKTGGSAVATAFSGFFYSREHWFIFHDHRKVLRGIPVGESVVFFLRDPIDRYVSSFNSRLRCGKPRNYNPWNEKEKMAFEEFGSANMLAKAISSDDTDVRRRARKAMRSIGHVNRSLWFWLESVEYLQDRSVDIFFIGIQESLANDFQLLTQKLKLSEGLTLTSDPVLAHRSPSDADVHLDPDAIENVSEWYSHDYDCILWSENWRAQSL